MTTPNPYELHLAEKVARRIGSKWSLVDVDDLTQELYLWMLKNGERLDRWRQQEGGDGALYVSLRREAAKYSAKEQASRVNRPIEVGNFYNAGMIERALPFVFEDTPQTSVTENPVSHEAGNAGTEFDRAVTIMADIRGAFYGLNAEVRRVLEWRFRDGLTLEEIGELRNVTKQAAQKQLERAISRLVDALSGERL